MIDGLRELLESIQKWPEISGIIPGRVYVRKSSGKLKIKIQYTIPSGLKAMAKGGTCVQEVFFISSNPEGLKKKLEAWTI